MKNVFIPTTNYQQLQALCADLAESYAGIEMAEILGRAGRGKTTAAERIVTMNPATVYVRFEERLSPVGLIREVAFAVAGVRPRSTEKCVEFIREEMKTRRRIIMVDEADRMTLRHLNTMRDFHDTCGVPVVLIGEEPLRAKMDRERRLVSRVRELLVFDPVSQADVVVFYRKAMDQAVEAFAPDLLRHAAGDFRGVIRDAMRIEKLMQVNRLKEITGDLVKQITDG